jgi:hypothetical protein
MTTGTDRDRFIAEAVAESIAMLRAQRAAAARDLADLQPGDFRELVLAANRREAEHFEQMVLDSAGDGAGRTKH